MITVNVYSEKGLCVKGISAEQAQAILGGLGKAVTQYNPMMGGYVFSRKREAQIRVMVAEMETPASGQDKIQGTDTEFVCGHHMQTMGLPATVSRLCPSCFDSAHCDAIAEDGWRKRQAVMAADTMPGPWTDAEGKLIG